MAVELRIDGYFEACFFDVNTKEEVSEEVEKEILNKLQSGDYIIGLNSREVRSLDNFNVVIYTFVIDPSDACEYEWDEL